MYSLRSLSEPSKPDWISNNLDALQPDQVVSIALANDLGPEIGVFVKVSSLNTEVLKN